MKLKQGIIMGLACIVCLGAGTGAGFLLGHNSQAPAGTAEPVLLGQGNPAPVDSAEPVLLGGICGITNTGAPTIPTQADSLLDKLAGLADDFNTLTGQAQSDAATRDGWLALLRDMTAAYSGKEKSARVSASLCDACAGLGVKLACGSGGTLDRKGWEAALAAIRAGIDGAQAKLEQTVLRLKDKYAQYEQAVQEMSNLQQNAGPGARITYADMRPLMKTVVKWAEGQVMRGESCDS